MATATQRESVVLHVGGLQYASEKAVVEGRLGAQPGWRLDPALEDAAPRAAPGLSATPAERARDEILGILAGPASAVGLRLLDRWGALEVLLPERAAVAQWRKAC